MEAVGRVKLADVAARAGVSVATVSKVVNGRYGVAKDTIALVQGVIDDLGYVGNLGASGLRSSRTNVVGILVADFEPYSAELIKGAAKATRNTQYDVLSYAGGEAPAWERRSLARLGGTLMDGAVVVTPTSLDSAISVPVVAVDPHYGPNWLPTIDSDGFGGAKSAANHLLELGHRRIAFLGGRQELDSSQLRESGFRDAMRLAGVPVAEELVRYSRYDPDIAQEVADAFLALPEPPTAIIAANDVTAMSAMAAARARGLTVPQDLSVVGFDDIPDASLCDPPLTTVRQPLQAMGEAAMTMLLTILDGRDHEQHIRMDTEFIVRSSTAPPRA
ncbi:LacI family DNA-binding transcriptional regulator [Demequina sp.]|uniref:LacI family DNA-binding transcriptional regulator n=1 Tax=Demequina sp. TaxID=2050685 RepID=UPI0025B9E257|nr:LacI family DNA-binding transcriptional regulator [Demequina sp.]